MSAAQITAQHPTIESAAAGRYRSLFWPMVMIGIGIVWLMANLGLISAANVSVIFRLWPLILMVIGVDLLFGRKSPAAGAIIGIGTVALFIGLMLVGPSVGLAQDLQVNSAQYSEPRADADSASINLTGTMGALTVDSFAANDDSNALFDAQLTYIGELEYDVTGTSERVVNLRQHEFDFGFDLLAFNWLREQEDLRWNVRLNPDVPLDLNINSGVGESQLNLSDLQLQSLDINSGVGQMVLSLPSMADRYEVNINSGTGQVEISIADNAALDLTVNGGVGQVNIKLPTNGGVGVRLDAQGGIGEISVPGGFRQISGDDGGMNNQGVWESDDFDDAERQITIAYSGGIGGLNIQ